MAKRRSAGVSGLNACRTDGSSCTGAKLPEPPTPPTVVGPGLLRMAYSAAKSLTKFLGSGLKTVPAEQRTMRLESVRVASITRASAAGSAAASQRENLAAARTLPAGEVVNLVCLTDGHKDGGFLANHDSAVHLERKIVQHRVQPLGSGQQ